MTTLNEMVITVDGGSASSADATVTAELTPVAIASLPALNLYINSSCGGF